MTPRRAGLFGVLLAVGLLACGKDPSPKASGPVRAQLAAAADSVLFQDDFSSGIAYGWTGQVGTWAVAQDSGTSVYKNGNASGDNWAVYGPATWTNYAIEARVKPLSFQSTGGIVRVFCRWQNATNWYYVNLRNTGVVQLRRYLNNAIVDLAPSKALAISPNTWVTLRLECVGSSLKAYVNGVLQLSATDTLFKAGPIAVGGWNDLAEFTAVRVVALGGAPPPPPAPVASVTVSPAADSLAIGQTVTLTARTYDATGALLTGRAVAWTSSASAVATVSAGGAVTAIGAGGASIAATSEGQVGRAAITVLAPPPPPPPGIAHVSVSPLSVAGGLVPGISRITRFFATVVDSTGAVVAKPVTWSSSDAMIATVDTAGWVSTTGVGTAAITAATSNGFRASGLITVSAAVPPRFNGVYADLTLRNGHIKIARRDSAGSPPILVTAGDTSAAGFRVRTSTALLHAAAVRQLAGDLASRPDTLRFQTANALGVDSVFCAALGCWVTTAGPGYAPWTSTPLVSAAHLVGLAHALEAAARGDSIFAPGDSLPYLRTVP